jgi:hypothetical protein
MPAMPAMNMPEMRNNAELSGRLEYTGPIESDGRKARNVGLKHAAVTKSSRHLENSYQCSLNKESGMINRLIEFSLKNRFLIVLAYLLLAGWGWALLSTPIDAIPDLQRESGDRLCRLAWPQPKSGRSDYLPPHRQSSGLPSVRTVRSSSAFGFSMVNIIFESYIDVYSHGRAYSSA